MIRFPVVFIISLLFAGHARGQAFTVEAEKLNIVYIGTDNPLTIVSGHCSCADLDVAADKGRLMKMDHCRFIYNADQPGVVTLTLSRKKAGKTVLLGTQRLRAKYIPAPEATVAQRRSKYFPVGEFKAQTGLSAQPVNFDTQYRFVIFSFRATVRRGNDVVFSAFNNAMLFNKECSDFFKTLKPGDEVCFTEIKAGGPDSMIRAIGDRCYTMQ